MNIRDVVNIRLRRSTWVLIALFVLTLVTYLLVRPAAATTLPANPTTGFESPAAPLVRPKATTKTTVPPGSSATPTPTATATRFPTSLPTIAPNSSAPTTTTPPADAPPAEAPTTQTQEPTTVSPQPTAATEQPSATQGP